MSELTRLLDAAAAGDAKAATDLLPLVYGELRKLAAARLAQEKPGQTLQPTALVHEAYIRLVGGEQPQDWNGRTHFFAAAAEAMRRILVEQARKKQAHKYGGGRRRVELSDEFPATGGDGDLVLDIDEALTRLQVVDPVAGRLVSLRYFGGLTMEEAADALGIPLRSAERNWTFARAWLHRALAGDAPAGG